MENKEILNKKSVSRVGCTPDPSKLKYNCKIDSERIKVDEVWEESSCPVGYRVKKPEVERIKRDTLSEFILPKPIRVKFEPEQEVNIIEKEGKKILVVGEYPLR